MGRPAPQNIELWCRMKRRCSNPKHWCYDRYGGRGIVVCERWKDDFEAFLADMGPMPGPEYTVERQDNDGPYSPDNCVWATKAEQLDNTSRSVLRDYRGQRMTLRKAVVLAGNIVRYATADNRIRLGWSVEAAVETPKLR